MTDIARTTALSKRRFRLPFARWTAVQRSRRDLARLDAHLLRDVGLTDTQSAQEAKRPIWDVPAPWRGVA